MVVNIARCPEHGLHGERAECFVCGSPVEQVAMVPAEPVARLLAAIDRRYGSTFGIKSFSLHWRDEDVDELLDAVRAAAEALAGS